jgi:hypothetical protein
MGSKDRCPKCLAHLCSCFGSTSRSTEQWEPQQEQEQELQPPRPIDIRPQELERSQTYPSSKQKAALPPGLMNPIPEDRQLVPDRLGVLPSPVSSSDDNEEGPSKTKDWAYPATISHGEEPACRSKDKRRGSGSVERKQRDSQPFPDVNEVFAAMQMEEKRAAEERKSGAQEAEHFLPRDEDVLHESPLGSEPSANIGTHSGESSCDSWRTAPAQRQPPSTASSTRSGSHRQSNKG